MWLSGKFVPKSVGGIRTGLNILECLKTNDICTYSKKVILQAYLEKNLVKVHNIY